MSLAYEDVDQTQALGELFTSDEGLFEVEDSDLNEAHTDSDNVDTLISTAIALEAIQTSLMESSKQNGIGIKTARSLDIAVEQYMLNSKAGHSKRLSVEGFSGGRITRLNATRVAMEDMGENIRRIVKRIIAWFKQMAIICYDLIERIYRGANAVVARCEKLYKIASAMCNIQVDRQRLRTISNSSLVDFFNVSGRPMGSREILKRFEDYNTRINNAFSGEKLYGPAVKGLNVMDTYVRNHGHEHMDVGVVEGFASEACENLIRHSLQNFNQIDKDGVQQRTIELPFGNSELVFSFINGTVLTTKRVGFDVSKESNPASGAPALPALSPRDVMTLLTTVSTSMNTGLYHDSKKIKASISDVTRRVEKQSLQVSDLQRGAGASVIPTLHLIKMISDSSMKLTRILYSYTGFTTRQLLGYSEASLAAYNKAKIT